MASDRRRLRTLAATASDAYLTMASRPWRSAAMMAGILLGVASSVAALVIADTQQARVDLLFDAQRSSHVVRQADQPSAQGFDESSVQLVARLEPVVAAGELSIWTDAVGARVSPYGDARSALIVGAEAGGLSAADVRTVAGLSHTSIGGFDDQPLVWVGEELAARLGVRLEPAASLHVLGRTYSVAGIIGTDGGFGYLNTAVVMPADSARTRYGDATNTRFLTRVRPGAASAVADYAVTVLDPNGEQRLTDVTQPDGRELQGAVAGDLRRIGVTLGLFVGLVGMVAVANTLGMAVNQRARELGLRSALGWSRLRIGSLILLESVLAGLVAATFGTAVATGGTAIWAAAQGYDLVVNPVVAPLAIVFGAAFSVAGGLLPAYRAGTASPLIVMRA